jgi:hypothetical protein
MPALQVEQLSSRPSAQVRLQRASNLGIDVGQTALELPDARQDKLTILDLCDLRTARVHIGNDRRDRREVRGEHVRDMLALLVRRDHVHLLWREQRRRQLE